MPASAPMCYAVGQCYDGEIDVDGGAGIAGLAACRDSGHLRGDGSRVSISIIECILSRRPLLAHL